MILGIVIPALGITIATLSISLIIINISENNGDSGIKNAATKQSLSRVNRTVLALALSFIVCWVPNAISNLLIILVKLNELGFIGELCWSNFKPMLQMFHNLTQFLLFTYAIANPVGVVYANRQYRRTVKHYCRPLTRLLPDKIMTTGFRTSQSNSQKTRNESVSTRLNVSEIPSSEITKMENLSWRVIKQIVMNVYLVPTVRSKICVQLPQFCYFLDIFRIIFGQKIKIFQIAFQARPSGSFH